MPSANTVAFSPEIMSRDASYVTVLVENREEPVVVENKMNRIAVNCGATPERSLLHVAPGLYAVSAQCPPLHVVSGCSAQLLHYLYSASHSPLPTWSCLATAGL